MKIIDNTESEQKMLKALEKAKQKAKRKASYLLKMEKSNPFMKMLVYFQFNVLTIIMVSIMAVIMFGFFGGIIARIIYEIWKIIFSLNL